MKTTVNGTRVEIEDGMFKTRTGKWYHGNPHACNHMQNAFRSKRERRKIYKLLRASGLPISVCRRLRDWRDTKIAIFITNYFTVTNVCLACRHTEECGALPVECGQEAEAAYLNNEAPALLRAST